jgi:hypothetical protein
MKKKVLIDATISCDPPSYVYRWAESPEEIAKRMEAWVRDFDEFMRDHRSQDPVRLSVERVYEDQCSLCGYKWDADASGCPCCCDAAMAEWEQEQKNKEAMHA